MAYFRLLIVMATVIPHCIYAAGLGIHPMEHFIPPSKSAIYIASNNLDKAIACEVVCESWTISEEGKELLEVTEDLMAFPWQFILKGYTYKKIRVTLRNPQKRIPMEKCYRVTIRELPISLEPSKPGTYFIYNASAYRTSFYVLPEKPKSELEIVESTFDGALLSVRIRNKGNTHIHLDNPIVILKTADGEEFEISNSEELAPMMGENMHAQITRRFQIDLSNRELPKNVTSAILEFRERGAPKGQRLELTW